MENAGKIGVGDGTAVGNIVAVAIGVLVAVAGTAVAVLTTATTSTVAVTVGTGVSSSPHATINKRNIKISIDFFISFKVYAPPVKIQNLQ
jgi:acetyltransferase-like isoleucine patch superfamily enzyme